MPQTPEKAHPEKKPRVHVPHVCLWEASGAQLCGSSTTVNTPLCLHWCLWATLFLKAQEPFLGVPLTHLCGLRAHPSGGFTEGTVTSGSCHTRTSKDGEFHGPMLGPGLSNSSAANTPCLRGAPSQRHSEHVHRAACQTSTIPSSRPLFPSS